MMLDQIIDLIKDLFDLSMVAITIDYDNSEVVVTVSKIPKGIREFKGLDETNLETEAPGKIVYTLVIYKNPEAEAYFVELLNSHNAILEVTDEFENNTVAAEQLNGLTKFIDPKYVL